MVFCPDCGKEVKDAKFCSNCGATLIKAEVPVEDDSSVGDVQESVVEVPVEDDSSVDDAQEIVDDAPVEEESEEIPRNESRKTKFCPNCGTEVDVEIAFCPQCGFKFAQEEAKPNTKFCQSCGEKININAEICPHCGVRVANFQYQDKSVLLAAILSFLFPGLGHLYLGLNRKGISFIIAYIVSAILIILLIGFILVLIVWLWALIDSIKSTEAINRGEYVEDKLF